MNVFKSPLVSIIIPTRDRPSILAQCLQHLMRQDYRPFEIIVVDNSTNDETASLVASFPQVIYIREERTHSNPAYLRNLGIARSRGEILAFIDDDSLVQLGWLEHLVRAYDDPTVGGVSGRVLQDNVPATSSREVGIFTRERGQIYNFNCVATEPFELDFVAGCNASFSRAAIDKVGGYDPAFGIIYEEQDLSFRVRQAGYKVIFQPGVEVYHMIAPRPADTVQRTTAQDFRTHFANSRSLTYFWLKNFGLDWAYLWKALVYWPLGMLKHWAISPSNRSVTHAAALDLGACYGVGLWVRWLLLRNAAMQRR